jgi:PAS domain S-box-containing protein
MQLVNEYEPDLVLLDLMMPHLSGFDLLAAFKSAGKLNGLMPVMVLTADANNESKQRALSEGASDFLTKPFAFFEVDLRIRNLLYNVQLLRQLQGQNDDLESVVRQRTATIEKVKDEIATSEAKYRMLFESNLDSITICSLDEKSGVSSIIDCNGGAEAMFGFTKSELLQMHMGQIELSEDAIHRSKIEELRLKGALSYEGAYRTKSGELRHMEVKVVRIELQGSAFAMHIASDTTERKTTLEALKQQNEALKEIAWHQSHVIRAPLARMMSLIALLKDIDPEEDEFDAYLNWICDSAEELDKVIRDITQKSELSKAKL